MWAPDCADPDRAFRRSVGVDVGKGSHQAAAYGSDTERFVGRLALSSSRTAVERFLRLLEHLAPEPDPVRVGIEATGHYQLTLVEFLEHRGYSVAEVNAYRAALCRCSQGHTAMLRMALATWPRRATISLVVAVFPQRPPRAAASYRS